MPGMWLLVQCLFFIAVFAPIAVHAQVARIEIHPLRSMTLTDQEFLSERQSKKSVTLAGELRIPTGTTTHFPAIVLVHGSGGVLGTIDEWSQLFIEKGIAVFVLDSFTGRGIVSTVEDQGQLGRLAMIVDIYRALDLLVHHPRISPDKIAVMGFSRGGQAVLYSSLRRFQRMYGPADGAEFAAYIVFYATCGTTFHDDGDTTDKPIRLFHGSADDYVPVAPCRSYVERLRNTGKDIQLTEYPNAQHGFDASMFTVPLRLAHAQTTRRCELGEAEDGQVVNSETGRPFSYTDTCVEHGATVAFDAQASAAARAAVQEFVTTTLKPE